MALRLIQVSGYQDFFMPEVPRLRITNFLSRMARAGSEREAAAQSSSEERTCTRTAAERRSDAESRRWRHGRGRNIDGTLVLGTVLVREVSRKAHLS